MDIFEAKQAKTQALENRKKFTEKTIKSLEKYLKEAISMSVGSGNITCGVKLKCEDWEFLEIWHVEEILGKLQQKGYETDLVVQADGLHVRIIWG